MLSIRKNLDSKAEHENMRFLDLLYNSALTCLEKFGHFDMFEEYSCHFTYKTKTFSNSFHALNMHKTWNSVLIYVV